MINSKENAGLKKIISTLVTATILVGVTFVAAPASAANPGQPEEQINNSFLEQEAERLLGYIEEAGSWDEISLIVESSSGEQYHIAHTLASEIPGVEIYAETSSFVSILVSRDKLDEIEGAAAALGGSVRVDPPAELGSVTDFSFPVPNDPEWGRWWGGDRRNLLDAFGVTTGHSDVVIAVLDTGVMELPELEGRVLHGWSRWEERAGVSGGKTDSAIYGHHGTRVAQVAAGGINNGIGASGTCPSCTILPVQLYHPFRENRIGESAVAEGIMWAVDNGADIINISLGTTERPTLMTEAVRHASDNGVLVVASAGNSQRGTVYPAGLPDVLGVAAEEPDRGLVDHFNRWEGISVSAPHINWIQSPDNWFGISGTAGTSFSAPYVAGLLGLYLSVVPGATREQIWEDLRLTSQPNHTSVPSIPGCWCSVNPDLFIKRALDLWGTPPVLLDASSTVVPGEVIELSGERLGEVNSVFFNDITVGDVVSVNDDVVSVSVPNSVSLGETSIRVTGRNGPSAPVTVDVIYPQPEVVTLESSGVVAPGGEVNVVGDWFVDGESAVTLGDVALDVTWVDRGRLTVGVPAVFEPGDYDLRVETPFGVSASIAVSVRAVVSDAPEVVGVERAGSGWDVFVGGATSGSRSDFFVVRLSPGDRMCRVDVSSPRCRFDGLSPGGTFTVVAQVENDAGLSPESAPFVFDVPALPPDAPLIDSVRFISGGLLIDFVAPVNDGGSAVVSYEYSLNGGLTWNAYDGGGVEGPIVVGVDRGEALGSASDIAYQVLLRAVNTAGVGAVSNMVTVFAPTPPPPPPPTPPPTSTPPTPTPPRVSPPVRPAAPTVRAQMGSIVVTMSGGTSGQTPTSLTATATPSGRSCSISGNGGTCTISGLNHDVHYRIHVVASNSGGSSPRSALSPVVTPGAGKTTPVFADVPHSSYFTRATAMLRDRGITTGYGGSNRFEPGLNVSRAEMAAFLWRMAGQPEHRRSCGWGDGGTIPGWAASATCWLRDRGITTGYGGSNRFEPGLNVSRAEMAAFLWRFAGQPTSNGSCGFTDGGSIPGWARPSTCWLSRAGITTNNPYRPGDLVSRAEMAAFLYRAGGTTGHWVVS